MLRAEAPLALLFLNNNLHALHHARPEVAWYRLRALAGDELPGSYDGVGYGALFRRYLFRIKDSPVHPAP